ncbi:MAG: aldo/keto reductase [Candidatus Bathyarchaeia archaeon]|jgi:aryl-alcohol dehydrogenase-like predicted oxidoreductase
MKFHLLGQSGLRVSELCLGTMTFGEDWGWGASKEECRAIFNHYVDCGGNFIDTANGYTNGTSERIVGELIGPDREKFVVATKYSFPTARGDPNSGGNHRKSMIRSLEGSLKRLGTDYIDLFWLHAWDFTTPIEEVMRALDDLVSSGRVLYVGVSDTPAWIVSRANMLADLRGWSPFVALQIEYNLIERTPERDLLPMARSLGMTVTPWGVLASGVLTGKYNNAPPATNRSEGGAERRLDAASAINDEKVNERNLGIASVVVEVAKEIGCSPSQVALAWLRTRPGSIVPILGARRLDQIRDNMSCLDVTLPNPYLRRLDEVSRIDLGFPHSFLASPVRRDRLYGGLYSRIVQHREP